MNELLVRLHLEYRASLGDKLSVLRALRDDPAALEGELHKIAGSAEPHGFSEIGDAARSAERLLMDGRDVDTAIELLFSLIEGELT